jgi:IS30 family transposase
VTQTQLNDIAELMNNRPRKTLDFKTPNEVMAEALKKRQIGSPKSVALDL